MPRLFHLAPRMIARILAILLLAVTGAAQAESIAYQLYELAGDEKRVLLAQGIREYTIRDVVVEESGMMVSRPFWSKEIPIANGFSAGASIYRDADLTGFGRSRTGAPSLERRQGAA